MNRLSLLLLAATACGLATVAGAAGFDDAVTAFESGDHETAVRAFRAAAEDGDASGQFALGVAHELGRGVAANAEQAAAWYRKAAAQGNPRAQACMGYLYAEGKGLDRDPARAVYWRAKAARQGNRYAAELLPSDLTRLDELRVAKSQINVRSAPDTGGTVLLRAGRDTPAWILSKIDGGWLELYFEQDHTVGYVADFLMRSASD